MPIEKDSFADEQDTKAPTRLIPQEDCRLALRSPTEHVSDHEDGIDFQGRAIYNLFARVKYWAAKKGPRQEGKRPADLHRAAIALRVALEMTWRAGFKGEALADELLRMMAKQSGEMSGIAYDKICKYCGSSIE